MEFEEERRLPLGIDAFAEICNEDYYYVDKTLLVRALLDNKSKVTLFTRPRRFGKTLNMDMLRTFFEVSDEDTAKYFKDKKIWTCGPKYTDKQGRYPVISLSLGGIDRPNWEKAFNRLAGIVQAEYRRQLSKLDPGRLDVWSRDQMNRFINEKRDEDSAVESLSTLTEILHGYYGVAPIVLIDEYDALVQNAWSNGYYSEAISFMRSFLMPTLKSNPHLSFACLSGILRVAKEGIFSGLNHIDEDGVLSTSFDEYFGFTPDEVRKIVEYYGVPEKYAEILKWYDGYLFGDQEVFNPWSVIKYFRSGCRPGFYWVNTSDNIVIKRVLEYADAKLLKGLTSLLNGDNVWSAIDESLSYSDIESGTGPAWARATYTLLLMSGYLTQTGEMKGSGRSVERELTIPNLELRDVYADEILMAIPCGFDDVSQGEIYDALQAGNLPNLEKKLTELLESSASFHDLIQERDYHLWLLGLLASMRGYRVTSNREAGKGRYDLCLSPRVLSRPGILIELKKADPDAEKAMAASAQKALKQIKKKDYAAELRAQGIRDMIAFGMGFSGKTVRIVSEVLE